MPKKRDLGTFRLKCDPSQEVAYLYLPDHPGLVPNCVAKTIELSLPEGLRSKYEINIDYDAEGNLIGIEFIDDR